MIFLFGWLNGRWMFCGGFSSKVAVALAMSRSTLASPTMVRFHAIDLDVPETTGKEITWS